MKMSRYYVKNGVHYGTADDMIDCIEELEAKLAKVEALMDAGFAEYERRLAKAVADMKALTDVSTLMQSSASHDRFKRNTIVTDSIWSQWSRQLKFARTTFAKLTGGKDA